MIRGLLSLLPAWLWALLLAGAAATVAIGSYRAGASSVRGEWDAAELRREHADADKLREDARIARAAAAEFEAWRADRQRKQAEVADALRNALRRPIAACPATVGDVVVPAAALDRLRESGADQREPAAAGESGR